jgi:hypothetical protein
VSQVLQSSQGKGRGPALVLAPVAVQVVVAQVLVLAQEAVVLVLAARSLEPGTS